ncbi:protein disulfide-isomerase domain [Allomyces macrogynus ATCC 38327]|uniref:Protein disulfide-isomerase domain n=1 Tax=Allomyces macrogynus (strain ATCC 38327) TaxID=578462 RepID=A0A0L0TBL8_ALLM3|nr:protein disulfide-isomerase domain [Allomyces macrogynus ATCC 38327]|eukprot:KNE72203.1 protein disulfide-isomerase domain [Allomyces macrogynus ATCC 38327]
MILTTPRAPAAPWRMVTALLALAVLAPALVIAADSLFTGAKVTELTAASFRTNVLDAETTHVVKFYAPWCGHCKQLAPEYAKAATKLRSSLVRVSAVNCDVEKALCAEQGIQGFPVVKVFYTSPKSGKRIPVEYQGERTAAALIKFTTSKIPNRVVSIGRKTGYTLDAFYSTKNSTLPKVLVVKPPSKGRKATTPLVKSLAIKYRDRLLIGDVSSESATDAVYADFAVPNDKAVLVVVPAGEGAAPVVYDGEVKAKPLAAFLDRYALPETKRGKRKPSKKPSKKTAGKAEKTDDGASSTSKTKSKTKTKASKTKTKKTKGAKSTTTTAPASSPDAAHDEL